MNSAKMMDALKCHETLIRGYDAQGLSDLEFKPRDEILTAQNSLLRKHLQYLAQNSSFYEKLFEKESIDIEAILSIDDLAGLPCTTKEDLIREDGGFVACPDDDVADVCMTSATTGDKPSILLQSFSDLSRLAYNEEKAFLMMGITSADTVAVCAATDRCFMAGLAYYLGGLNVGARMVRAGAGSSAQHWHTIKATGATVIVGVPSFIRRIGRYAINSGEALAKSKVRKLVAIGESIRDEELNLLPSAKLTEELWGAPIYSTYASTEIATAFCECPERIGGHQHPELVVVEVLDDEGKPVADGDIGEVVVTPLGVTGMPLLRFRTGDTSFLIDSPCPCGRTTPRLGPIVGRKNQMLKYKGTTVFPSSLIVAVETLESVGGAYVEARQAPDGTDDICLYVTLNDGRESIEKITEHLRACVRVVPEVRLICEEEYRGKVHNPEKRKRVTFFDLR